MVCAEANFSYLNARKAEAKWKRERVWVDNDSGEYWRDASTQQRLPRSLPDISTKYLPLVELIHPELDDLLPFGCCGLLKAEEEAPCCPYPRPCARDENSDTGAVDDEAG